MANPEDKRIEDDDDGDSSSDEDFNPEVEANEDEDSVSSEDEQPQPTPSRAKKGKKRKRVVQKEPEIELDSGDEATIQEKKKRQRRGEDADFLSDDGGDAGFIKTRSQRQKEHHERRPLASTFGSTIDVDAVWARLSAFQVGRPPTPPPQTEELIDKSPAKPVESEEDYITIKRTIKFAGEVTTETKRVHKHSAEARLYLKEQEDEKRKDSEKEDVEMATALVEPSKPALRRPLKRPSRFEPNPTGEVKSLPPNLQLRWPRNKYVAPAVAGSIYPNAGVGNARMPPPLAPATKLNTVEKSRYDWAGFVDKEGIAEELDEYGKSKQSYMGRAEFLNRTENRREDEMRDMRMKGK